MMFNSAPAQDAQTAYGRLPGYTYLSDMNLGTGDVNVKIPLLKLSGRGGHDFAMSLSYNNQMWYGSSVTPTQTGVTTYFWQVAPNWTWTWTLPSITSDMNIQAPYGHGQAYCGGNFRVKMWDGHVVYFPSIYMGCTYLPNGGGASVPGAENHQSSAGLPQFVLQTTCLSDRSILEVPDSGPIKLHLENGETLWFQVTSGYNGYILYKDEDANGNVITFAPDSATHNLIVTDTVGRTITITGSWGQNWIQSQIGGSSVPSSVIYTDSNGNSQTITLTSQSWYVNPNLPSFGGTQTSTNYPAGPVPPANWTILTSVVLANGDRWDMRYDLDPTGYSYGELTKITYPTGGYTTYQYEFAGLGESQQTINSATTTYTWGKRQVYAKQVCRDYNTRNEGGSCSMATDNETLNPPNAGVTNATNSVVNAVGDQTLFTFGGPFGGLETQRKVYSGTATLLRTVDTTPSCEAPRSKPPHSTTLLGPP